MSDVNEGLTQTQGKLREINEELDRWRGLGNHDGFKDFVRLMKEQVDVRRDKNELTPVTGFDGLIAREFDFGEIAGLRFAAEFVYRQIEALEDLKSMLVDEVSSYDPDESED